MLAQVLKTRFDNLGVRSGTACKGANPPPAACGLRTLYSFVHTCVLGFAVLVLRVSPAFSSSDRLDNDAFRVKIRVVLEQEFSTSACSTLHPEIRQKIGERLMLPDHKAASVA